MGWLLVLDLKECLVECATVCVKSGVILFCVKNDGSRLHLKLPSRKVRVETTKKAVTAYFESWLSTMDFNTCVNTQ